MNFLNTKYARILTLLLLLQGGAFYALALRPEHVPGVAPLSVFSPVLGTWRMVQDIPIEKETLDILKADDTLNRIYIAPDGRHVAYLFIAFFKTQRQGQAPHSPKNCLPGSGWEPILSDRPSLDVPGRREPIVINRYVTEHGMDKSVTLYWYQSHQRIIASELAAKFWSIADSVRYRRSDTAVIRVTIPVANNDVDAAVQTGYEFTRAAFPEISRQLPI
jgi:EpsI family protein